MTEVGIVAGGPKSEVPPLKNYKHIDYWIGVDEGSLFLLENEIQPNLSIGDFDSVDEQTSNRIQKDSQKFTRYPQDKNETDLELAIKEAIKLSPSAVYIFGATGGRLDHEWMNIMLLKQFADLKLNAWIVDRNNEMTMKLPGTYELHKDAQYSYVSFLPFSEKIVGLTLKGFKYNLDEATIEIGSSLTVSNEWSEKKGTYFFNSGILLVIKSRDFTL